MFATIFKTFEPLNGKPPILEYATLFSDVTIRARRVLEGFSDSLVQEIADLIGYILTEHPAKQKKIEQSFELLLKQLENEDNADNEYPARLSNWPREILAIYDQINLADIVEYENIRWEHIFSVLALLCVGCAKEYELLNSNRNQDENSVHYWQRRESDSKSLALWGFEALESVCYSESFAKISQIKKIPNNNILREAGRKGAIRRYANLNNLKRDFYDFVVKNRTQLPSKAEAARIFLKQTPRSYWHDTCKLKDTNAARTLLESLPKSLKLND